MPAAAMLLAMAYVSIAAAETSNAVAFLYHRFGEEAFPTTSVRLDQFDAHLSHLEEAGYTVRPLAWIAARIAAGEPVPDGTVAITMDDAYLSIYTEAYPRLRQRGWPFTVFVATDPVDQGLPDYLDWAQIREMKRNGATFANHTASHAHLVRRLPGEDTARWRARVAADIRRGRLRLEEELGETPMLFAYPFGEYDTELAALVRELGYVGFGQHSGAIGPHSDLRALPRFAMSERYAGIADFRQRAASLALPVLEIEPWDPVVEDARRAPALQIRVGGGGDRPGELACFASHTGAIEVRGVEGRADLFVTQAPEPLPRGRSRYNCTAPSSWPGRFYWFSQPWLRLPAD